MSISALLRAIVLATLATFGTAKADVLRAVTADLPPYAIEADSSGFTLEVTRLAAERAGHTLEIRFLPWKRAQLLAQQSDDLLTFNLTRTKTREPLYLWIAPIIEYGNVFVTTGTVIDTFETAASAGETVTRAGTAQASIVAASGAPFLEVESPERAARMLDSGRVAAWYTHDLRAAWVWRQEARSNDLTIGAKREGGVIYLAGSLGFPEDIANDLREAIEAMRADGTYAALAERYFGKTN
ncbi:substrate-binding periplasmic protein [Jannaschia aquimarina]|uniref:Bacterial extracellular solute-binding protein, family 3 n=1 Tax=Jannaschia aquimarina TaxID=935700 RepID=A0A0D1EEJ6_9RHOB|nr:transporter substrate-binding domain-containing protein [Jannaschia aquimarina]KIT14305.1 Bacterial extracellular solute-binding protein, family 3 [Jannaschia aquimarina]SNS50485.1 amino acid ABC transporter substrate-binding protein, PAAT family [Jannaschia aquimarina]